MRSLPITRGDLHFVSIPRGVLWTAAITCGIIVSALGARVWLQSGLSWTCPSITLFGLPCPSCGSTRALAALVELDFLRALTFNPLVVFGLGFLLIAPLFRIQNE